MTCCSSSPTSRARVATKASWCRVRAETIACDSSNDDEGRSRPASTRRRTAPGLAQRQLGVDHRVERPVDRDQVAGSDELVQLQVMDVAALPPLGGVQHHEHVVGIGVHLGHVVALDAVADGQ
jgi:hypothetical protein